MGGGRQEEIRNEDSSRVKLIGCILLLSILHKKFLSLVFKIILSSQFQLKLNNKTNTEFLRQSQNGY